MASACHFLNTPIEIRRMIYSLVLLGPGWQIDPQYHYFDVGQPKPKLSVQLLRTNRQISQEASAVLYGCNNFDLTDYFGPFKTPCKAKKPLTPLGWLALIGPHNLSCIRNLKIDWEKPLEPPWDSQGYHQIHEYIEQYESAKADRYDVIATGMEKIFVEAESVYVKRIAECLQLLADGCTEFQDLGILLPGDNAFELDIDSMEQGWMPPIFKEDMFQGDDNAAIVQLARIKGVRKLYLGHTSRLARVEILAQEMGVDEIEVECTDVQEEANPTLTEKWLLKEGWTLAPGRGSYNSFRKVLRT